MPYMRFSNTYRASTNLNKKNETANGFIERSGASAFPAFIAYANPNNDKNGIFGD